MLEDLIIESIQIYGIDVYYCPRTLINADNIFHEDRVSEYNSHYILEMYIKNVEGFEGEGHFLSKFNIQIRDEITFTVANRTFANEVETHNLQTRPKEGDLIYFPLTQKVYVIKYAEHEPIFYQMGSLQTFDLKCELFEYSSERLNTGVPEIDVLGTNFTLNKATKDANNNITIDPTTGHATITGDYPPDHLSDNDNFQISGNSILDLTETNPFGDI